MTALTDLIHIPLAKAFLCQDCRAIGNQSERCPACASSHCLMSLANLLDRKSAEQRELEGFAGLESAVSLLESALEIAPASPAHSIT